MEVSPQSLWEQTSHSMQKAHRDTTEQSPHQIYAHMHEQPQKNNMDFSLKTYTGLTLYSPNSTFCPKMMEIEPFKHVSPQHVSHIHPCLHINAHTHTHTWASDNREKLKIVQEPDDPKAPKPSNRTSTSIYIFFSFLFFILGLFSLQTLNVFSREQRCCRGTNRLFCQIAKNFKVCLTCTLGRPALGVSSHWDLGMSLKSTTCIYTINIQRSLRFAESYMAPLN